MKKFELKNELKKPDTLESKTDNLIKKFESIDVFKRLADLNFWKSKIKINTQKLDGWINKWSILQTFSLEQNWKKILELRIFNKPNWKTEISNTFWDFWSINSTSEDLESNMAAIDKFIEKFKEYEKFENQKKFDKNNKEKIKLNNKIKWIEDVTKINNIPDPVDMLNQMW